MGSLQAETEEKREMDDSGCIQDETPPGKRCANGVLGVQLLDLSDDVLLMILKYLAPRDLKALGYCCPRLGALILDRSLWQIVDARGQPWGRARLRWYLARALHAGTRELLVTGYAREARECLGHINQTREEIEAAKVLKGDKDNGREEDNNNQPDNRDRFAAQRIIEVPALGPNAQLLIDDQRPESPEAFAWPRPSDPLISDSTCPGPQFTLTQHTLRQLTDTCPALTSLALEYCNINCNCTNIGMFPPTLTKLSLRGSKCYNLPLDRSFLFKIQDSLPDLESLDVSECEWMEPATLLPLSKLPALKHLYARDCLRLTEFVAYASLATRYGFTKLQSLDLRGSPVGDSEVSALGWLANLSHLWLSPARSSPAPAQHSHHKKDCLPSPATEPRDQWEEQEPEYLKLKEPDYDSSSTPEKSPDELKHTWQARLNGNSDYSSSIPTVLSSSTISSPTMIINASPLRPGSSRLSPQRNSSSNPTMIINASSMRPSSSNDRTGSSNDSSRATNSVLSPTMIINASPMRPSSSNDSPRTAGSSSDSPKASNSLSSPTMIINASPMRPSSSNDSTRAAGSSSDSPKASNAVTSPTMIINASPMRPSSSNYSPRAAGSSSDSPKASNAVSSPTMIINASPMRPSSSNDSPRAAGSSSDSPKASNAVSSPTMIINASPMRPSSSNDSPRTAGSSSDSPKASNAVSSPTMIINASPMRPGSSNDTRANTSNQTIINASPIRPSDNSRSSISCLSMSPNISITRTNASSSKCCNIITPSRLRSRSPNGKAPKRKTSSPTPGPSKRKRDDDSSSSDDDVPLKCLIKDDNEGASTSRESEDNEEEENGQEEEEAQPRHHVLYVNVGQRLHAVYRLSLDNEHVVSFNRNSHLNRIDTRNMFLSPPSHLDASSLVTDSAIRRFGRADGEDINYVHIGPNGPYPGAQVPGARPDRSSLTHLSVTGFRTITDRSLEHLATSAPLLQYLDLSESNVSDAGVATFRSLRPDCEVVYSKYEKKD